MACEFIDHKNRYRYGEYENNSLENWFLQGVLTHFYVAIQRTIVSMSYKNKPDLKSLMKETYWTSLILKMEVQISPKPPVNICQLTCCHIPQDFNFHNNADRTTEVFIYVSALFLTVDLSEHIPTSR
jgi:hypothetical protein